MSALAPPALTPPPQPFPPRPLRITAAQFNQMGDMGWFEGRRAFLLDGVVLEQGPMNAPHATGLALVTDALRAVFTPGWVVRTQSPLRVDEFNDPLPDAAVVPGGPRDYLAAHPTTAALVVEVSDTTLRADLTDKAERYAAAGIPEYWVLDVDGRALLVLRDPARLPAGLGAAAYRTHLALGPTDAVSPLAAPAAAVRVADLLP
jgi:Uma2 family endonuclease